MGLQAVHAGNRASPAAAGFSAWLSRTSSFRASCSSLSQKDAEARTALPPRATPGFRRTWQHRSLVLVYAIVDLRSSSDHPLGDAVETFVRREDAERFLDEPELAEYLRIEERQLEAGGLN